MRLEATRVEIRRKGCGGSNPVVCGAKNLEIQERNSSFNEGFPNSTGSWLGLPEKLTKLMIWQQKFVFLF